MRTWIPRGFALWAILLLTGTLVLTGATPALAFSGTGAANYAEAWATARNWQYPSYTSDCANFASQALHSGGGYSYMYLGSGASNAWWCRYRWWWPYNGGFDNSNSWSRANDLRNFLLADWPGGWDWGLQNEWSSTNNAQYGDIIFYDWDGNGTYDHAAVEVSYWGTDPTSGRTGDLVDEHTSDRRHAIWNLLPYNDKPGTTRIDVIHVDSRNL